MRNLFKKKKVEILQPTEEQKKEIVNDMMKAMFGKLSPKCQIEIIEELAVTFILTVAYSIDDATHTKGELDRVVTILDGIAEADFNENSNNEDASEGDNTEENV